MLQENISCTANDLIEFGKKCQRVRLSTVTEEAQSSTLTALVPNGCDDVPRGKSWADWVGHVEDSRQQNLTNEQCNSLATTIARFTIYRTC